MALYRRLGDVGAPEEIDAFAAELVDRFGKMPREVEQLLEIVAIKAICRRANIAKIDAGPKGAVLTFRHDRFENVAGLVQYMNSSPLDVKLRPDQKVVFRQEWEDSKARIRGAKKIASIIAEIAAAA
jgi:transcription-repair coupling factor (superfamily II helicase)